jgi:hypothetical protein
VLLREEGRLLSLCLPTRRGVYGHTRLCVRRRQICTNTLVGRSAISCPNTPHATPPQHSFRSLPLFFVTKSWFFLRLWVG